MDINFFEKYLPTAVLTAVFVVIILVYLTVIVVTRFEDWIEAKKGRQIKIFDHKKIWLNLFWDVVISAALALAGFIQWKEAPFYCFVIMGLSTFFYEAVLKKFHKNES